MDALLSHLDDTSKAAIELIVVIALLDFALGTLRAISDKSFTLDAIDVWVRTKLLGRVIPITLVLLVGAVIGDVKLGDFSFNIITAAAFVAAATFVAAEAKSIVDSLNRTEPNPVPVE